MSPLAFSYCRFSSRPQEKGDSVRRQIELAERYATQHGYVLDTSMRDLGRSAFVGDHRRGALGGFLGAVQAGQIPADSVMLVEAVDRVSREHVLDSLSLFTTILNSGITIVTLEDNSVYTRESVNNNGQIYLLIGKINQAHSESRSKSQRVGAAWSTKKQMATSQNLPMTKVCPAWLRLSDDRKSYIIIPDRAEIVKTIFNNTVNGVGKARIARILNEQNVSPFSEGVKKIGNGWYASYITKIVRNRSVIGEYQPHIRNSTTNKKRLPVGEVIPNYFPAIITHDLFRQAQDAKESRSSTGGKQSATIANLLAGLCQCCDCGGKLTYRDKGKQWQYLMCDNAIRKASRKPCDIRGSISYGIVETGILNALNLLNATGQLTATNTRDGTTLIRAEIARLEDSIRSEQASLDSLVAALSGNISAPIMAAIQKKSDSIEAQQLALKEAQSRLRKALPSVSTQDRLTALLALGQAIRAGDVNARKKVQNDLRTIIDRIIISIDVKLIEVHAFNGFLSFRLNEQGSLVDGYDLNLEDNTFRMDAQAGDQDLSKARIVTPSIMLPTTKDERRNARGKLDRMLQP